MARKVNLLNVALKLGRAVAAEQRRAQKAAIRQHNEMVRQQNALARQAEQNLKQAEREHTANQKAAERDAKNRLREQTLNEKARQALEKAQQKEEALRLKEEQKQEYLRYIDERKQEGIDRDNEAKAEIDALKNILSFALGTSSVIDWDQFVDKGKFEELPPKLELPSTPEKRIPPVKPTPERVPEKPAFAADYPEPPDEGASKYRPVLGLLDRIVPSYKAKKVAEAKALFQKDHEEWLAECENVYAREVEKWESMKSAIETRNAAQISDWERAVERTKTENTDLISWWEKNCVQARAKHSEALTKWEQRKEKFYKEQTEQNEAVQLRLESYNSLEQEAIADYCDAVLSNSVYPDYFPKEWDIHYNADANTILVEYALPAPESLPTLKEVQYIQSKDDYKESYISDKERDAIYDSLIYQMTLRTIHELFESDKVGALEAVAFNGIVTSLDKTTGHDATACILSILVRKEPFREINLRSIDPKACFKKLKGVAASSLVGLTAVSPIMMLDKNDRRFTAAYGVTEHIDEGTNLATMDWEDFEHLIREIFEQEFASGGGEVKVTQASRDGGVDAVAFDPDPIRGGKIVIQAKRYANTVGVSAVRDLYGTVMNEGAIKGLLVTTADYGPDAYEFANGKPLTLLNGSNLLHLLEKHGRKARINLNEAKQENKQLFEAEITRKYQAMTQ